MGQTITSIQVCFYGIFLAGLCSIIHGQEKPTGGEWAELLSRSVERATTEFIQVPGPNPVLVPGESGWDSRIIEAGDISIYATLGG